MRQCLAGGLRRTGTSLKARVTKLHNPQTSRQAPHRARMGNSASAGGAGDAAAAAAAAAAPPRPLPQLLSVAPMMDWTDLHYRQLARLMSRHAVLYTEMVVDSTLIHNPNRDKFLWFPPEQHPIVCQLGGSNPEQLGKAAAIVAKYGYDEINLNCGCPSDRVAGAGCFGAAMMLRPQLVADCCKAIAEASGLPVTVKCRLGVDDFDTYPELVAFVRGVAAGSPVTHFVVHARKCLLRGLSPHQNRTVPPLRYEWVWALKRDFPHLLFSLNGGVTSLAEATAALRIVNGSGGESGDNGGGGGILGVMIGRAAYYAPWDTLADADRAVFGAASNPAPSRREVMRRYAEYADGAVGRWGVRPDGYAVPSVRTVFKPLLGMFHNQPRGKRWRAAVDEALKTATSVSAVLDATLGVLDQELLDAPPTPTPDPPAALEHYAAELPPTPAAELLEPAR